MFTILEIDNKEVSFVTQQYEMGTYFIINNDPSMQGGSKKKEKDYHISIRRKAIKSNINILRGTIFDHNGKIEVNKFKDEIKL